MSSFFSQVEEIKSQLSSKYGRPFAYSTLLHLQQQLIDDPSAIEALAQNSTTLFPLLLADISVEDEETAILALKCLGFMIYHPSLVTVISEDNASLVFESLVRLIITTKMKSVCNTSVWCLSIQQFDALVVAVHFSSLLRAVLHAIDNPMGSLSTTYEAMQCIMKFSVQLSEKMSESSHIWLPPIYRRLLSIDKRERDMSERCLLKIESTVLPPSLTLSEVLVVDMKKNLISGMKDMSKRGMKVQSVQAWGWFIRFMGSHALKNRQLINDMLTILEHTFSDPSPQVQIASQAAWEGLIDAFIQAPAQIANADTTLKSSIQQIGTSQQKDGGIQGSPKILKLIMTPLTGIIRSNCDLSVYLSCFGTWCYLMHKLDVSINYPSVRKLILDPMLIAVFQRGPSSKSLLLWNVCLNLLDDYISVKFKGVEYDRNGKMDFHLTAGATIRETSMPEKSPLKLYPIKWFPWDLSQLNLFLEMIEIIFNQTSIEQVTPENRSLACNAALRIFRSVLKGIQVELKDSLTSFVNIMLCLNTILSFVKKIDEEVNLEGSGSEELSHLVLHLVEAVVEELEVSVLASPLYKIALNLKYIENLQLGCHGKFAKHSSCITYLDMVSPIVYLLVLYVSVGLRQALDPSKKIDLIQRGTPRFFGLVLTSYDSLEIILASVSLLHQHIGFCYMKIWIALAEGLRVYVDGLKDISVLRNESDYTACSAICPFLSYPFIVCSLHEKMASIESDGSFVEHKRKPELEHIIKAWKTLYYSVTNHLNECSFTNQFPNHLCAVLNELLDEYTSELEIGKAVDRIHSLSDLDMLCLTSDVLVIVFQKTVTLVSDITKNKHTYRQEFIHGILGFTSRFLRLSLTNIGKQHPTGASAISSVISALVSFVTSLRLKQHILVFIEIMSCSLVQLLSCEDMQDSSITCLLEDLWAEILNCLQRSQPSITFDSSFIQLQAGLLEKTLDHPILSISEQTIKFWNATYGNRMNLIYPKNLVSILDKLSRQGRVNPTHNSASVRVTVLSSKRTKLRHL